MERWGSGIASGPGPTLLGQRGLGRHNASVFLVLQSSYRPVKPSFGSGYVAGHCWNRCTFALVH